MAVSLLETAEGVGARIDRYDLVAELASGGMATVYLARLSAVGGFQRTFAIKRLHPHLADNADFVHMFLDEARLAALIRHPNVVPILEVGQGAEGYYLVMEYIEGDTFASVLSKTSARGRRIPTGITLRIIIDMLQGLHAAHELKDEHGMKLGLVHRDVSPQNVMVGTDGITRITDFGVARAASALSQTKAGQLKGKLAYMAPEQASGREDIDRRVDIFAAGIVMWEALAFKRLFKANNEATTLSRVLTEPIVSPALHNPDVPEAVAAVCLKALERDLSLRYPTCAEFAAELERVAQETGQLATVKDVAEYVEEVVGSDMESHRVAIRRWMERRERESSLPSLPPPELSSVTMTSRMPPAGPSLVPASRSTLPSATQSGVIATGKPRGLYIGLLALLAAGAVAAALVTLDDPSPDALEAEARATPGPKPAPAPSAAEHAPEATEAASVVSAASAVVAPSSGAPPSGAPSSGAPSSGALPPESTTPSADVASSAEAVSVVSSEELPEADESAEEPASATPPRRRHQRRSSPPPRKKPKLPDLDNPYQ